MCAACGRSWKTEILVVEAEESQEHHAPEVHVKRINAKEGIVVKERDKFMFPRANGMIQLSGTNQKFGHTINGKDPKRWKNTTVIIQDKKTLNLILLNMRWKRRMSSGVFLEPFSADTVCKHEQQKLQVPQEAHFRFHANYIGRLGGTLKHGTEFSAERKTTLGKRKTEARQCQKIDENFHISNLEFGESSRTRR